MLPPFFCIETLVKQRAFIFDSIGSSESTVTLTDSREPRSNAGELCMGAAKAAGDEKTAEALRQRLSFRRIQADHKWGGPIRRQAAELLSFYRDMNAKTLPQLLH